MVVKNSFSPPTMGSKAKNKKQQLLWSFPAEMLAQIQNGHHK